MSLYCKGKDCPKANECHRADQWEYWKSKFPNANQEEGFATGLWFVKEQECINNDYEDGVFFSCFDK